MPKIRRYGVKPSIREGFELGFSLNEQFFSEFSEESAISKVISAANVFRMLGETKIADELERTICKKRRGRPAIFSEKDKELLAAHVAFLMRKHGFTVASACSHLAKQDYVKSRFAHCERITARSLMSIFNRYIKNTGFDMTGIRNKARAKRRGGSW